MLSTGSSTPKRLDVGFKELPESVAVIAEGALVVPYVRAVTDRKQLAFIDPFALSHAFLYGAFPKLAGAKSKKRNSGKGVH